MIQDSMIAAPHDVFPALVAGLEREFGTADCGALAQHFIEAEEADFYWESRSAERHLGRYDAFEDDEVERDRVAIIGRLAGRWYMAVMVVDGDGAVDRMLHLRRFDSMAQAARAYRTAR